MDLLYIKDPLKEILDDYNYRVEVKQSILYLDEDSAKEKMRHITARTSQISPLYAIYIYEFPINRDVSNEQFQRVWVYDRMGALIDRSYATEVIEDVDHTSSKFREREFQSIRFKPGEIVEVYDRKLNVMVRGIVA